MEEFVVKELQLDESSGTVVFAVACLLLGIAYFSFQSFVNEWLQPVIERIFRNKHPHIEPELEIDPIAETPQEKATVSNYNEYKLTTQQMIQQKQEQTLGNVLSYTGQEFTLCMTDNELQQLCEHIHFSQLASEDGCDKTKLSVVANYTLCLINLMHFGWNISNQFKKIRHRDNYFYQASSC